MTDAEKDADRGSGPEEIASADHTPPAPAQTTAAWTGGATAHMRAFITHGRYGLVTPYFATDRLRNLMRLDPSMADRLAVQHFPGGHMFYAWADSRQQFTAAIARFVAEATDSEG